MKRAPLILALVTSACAQPGDELRIVHPVSWHELAPAALHEMCLDWSAKTRGCVISRHDGDHIYTLPVCSPTPAPRTFTTPVEYR